MTKFNKLLCFPQHGESEFNVIGRIGGDANLSARGQQYAHALAEYINAIASHEPLSVWTSELRRTKQTSAEIRAPKRAVRALNELDAVSILINISHLEDGVFLVRHYVDVDIFFSFTYHVDRMVKFHAHNRNLRNNETLIENKV